ncbi:hypothetical protein, partial [Staphylococcus aureus]
MIRRPPRSTRKESSAASDVYKRQNPNQQKINSGQLSRCRAVSYTHLRAHETLSDLVCRLLLEKKIFLMIRRPPRSTRKE